MTTLHPLPTLFGRLSTILSEHDHLKGTLGKLAEMCLALESGRTTLPSELEPERLIGALRAELTRHFVAEEGVAHFGAMAEERPELLPRIVELKTDHVTMLQNIADLTLIASAPERRSELPPRTLELMAKLRAHEKAEAELVREFMLDERVR
ncbi:MAG TPA: hemerythrin domain-containing protein [Polyangiaceae bacterium]|jgi:hypothetical protein|nr:hemerythrin domain-containing protein [Polyangiaceae bacterium]